MLRVRFTRLLAWVGRKLGLINCLTGAWMFRIKNPGSRLDSLFPTSTSTTSCPLLLSSFSIEMACVRCPLPSP